MKAQEENFHPSRAETRGKKGKREEKDGKREERTNKRTATCIHGSHVFLRVANERLPIAVNH